MPRRAQLPNPTFPPTITPHKGIEVLRQQIERLDSIGTLSRHDPETLKWKNTTRSVLEAAFGKPNGDDHEMTRQFLNCGPSPEMNRPDSWHENRHKEALRAKRAVLESAIEQLEMLGPGPIRVAEGGYQFHPEIERVSRETFRNGHFKQAAFEAYIRVINEVKNRSSLTNLDGDPLMNRAFGCDSQRPPIRFTPLTTPDEIDEQRGFMHLFKGVVGLRNAKAHSNRTLDDPYRAYEYLALASLLMRMLEQAETD